MKITSFNPSILTKDSESVINLFEELGFERTHTKTGVSEEDVSVIRMKNADGFQLDVVQNENVTRDQALIRMNVDDFDEAFEKLTAHGFKNRHENITETGSSRSAVMVSPSGYEMAVIQHIRKETE
jgi:predicted enzyme related to lactoylglutathione lyase